MLTDKTIEKLRILTESAKYDVSCSSSGTVRKGKQGMVGNTVGGMGICHSFADDGRCISLLKVMLTNYCMYDCAYCVVMKKAKYFITCGELTSSFSQPIIGINELRPERLRPLLLSKAQQKRAAQEQQLSLDFQDDNP